MKITKYEIARFWSRVRVETENSCWYWDNPTHKFGYGWFRVGGKNRLAHRVAKIIWDGRDKGLQVLHNCDNPACCNPKHLRWGTPKDNVDDCIKRNRFVYPPPSTHNPPIQYGKDNFNSKMTEETVIELRKERAQGATTIYLSEKYGIRKSTVWQIINYHTWKNIPRREVTC